MRKGIGIKGFKWKERAEGGIDLIKERTEGVEARARGRR